MIDCTNGGRRAYNAPTHSSAEDRLEITVHFHGEFNPHQTVLNRLDREVDYVTVDGERFERVRECSVVNDIEPRDTTMRVIGSCSECGHILCRHDWCCAHCGARVKEVGA